MSGTTAISPSVPAPVTGTDLTINSNNGGSSSSRKKDFQFNNSSQVNAYRIAAVLDRFSFQLKESKFDSMEFFNLCLSLARGVDFAVANQETPTRAQELPLLLKQLFVQVCQSRNDPLLLAAFMVLMISVKNACESRWFSDKDSEELCGLANQIENRFCSSMDFNTDSSSSQSTISTIMTRFYPRLKMGRILMFLEVKPGFGAYVRDFQISKQLKHSPDEKVRLFIAQTDNIETPSCLVSPQDVNFLLNGKAVDRRTNLFMDTGPQMPSIVTHILKYGSNLLQAVGQFNGNYVIVVALMSESSTMENLVLEGYVQPAATVVDPDSEIIEGPSRISLNCPISLKRIKTPVKGHTCKHLQCFDFDNYLDINSKRPSWRCPHCNHQVCFTDIRVDQNMAEVLKDVGENVNDVIISSDGSWTAIMESDDHAQKKREKFSVAEQDGGPKEPGSGTTLNSPLGILDLTEADDELDVIMGEANERKVFPDNFQAQGMYLSTFGSASPMSAAQNVGVHEPLSTNVLVSPMVTDANSPAPDCEAGAFLGNALVATSGPQNEISSQSSLQLQASQFGNSLSSHEYGRSVVSAAQHVNRQPIAVQALPAQAPGSVSQRPRNTASTMIQTGPLAVSQASAAPWNTERQQQFSRSHDSVQVPQMGSASMQQRLYPQQGRQSLPLPAQRPTVASNQFRVPHPLPSQFQNSSAQSMLNRRSPHAPYQSPGISSPQIPNFRTPNTVNKPAGMISSSTQSAATTLQSQGHQGGLQGQHALLVAAQATMLSRLPSFSGNNTEGPRPDSSGNSPPDQDWRPSGRMRGSLSGRAYSDALQQYIIQPTQNSQAPQPPPTAATIPPNASSQLQMWLANRTALQEANYPSTELSGTKGVWGVPPPQSSDKN